MSPQSASNTKFPSPERQRRNVAPARSEILRDLAERIQKMEVRSHAPDRAGISLGFSALDEFIPDRHLPAGAIVELLSAADGAGAWTLALLMARQAYQEHKVLVIADAERNFYPPAAKRLGLDFERLMVVHPCTSQDLLAALDQSLRCPAVGAVVSWCDPLPTVNYRRLQLAAEAGGGTGFFLRPGKAARSPSFAFLRLLISPVPVIDSARRLHVDVLRCRRGKTASSLILEIDDETGDVRLPAPLAAATTVARAQ